MRLFSIPPTSRERFLRERWNHRVRGVRIEARSFPPRRSIDYGSWRARSTRGIPHWRAKPRTNLLSAGHALMRGWCWRIHVTFHPRYHHDLERETGVRVTDPIPWIRLLKRTIHIYIDEINWGKRGEGEEFERRPRKRNLISFLFFGVNWSEVFDFEDLEGSF